MKQKAKEERKLLNALPIWRWGAVRWAEYKETALYQPSNTQRKMNSFPQGKRPSRLVRQGHFLQEKRVRTCGERTRTSQAPQEHVPDWSEWTDILAHACKAHSAEGPRLPPGLRAWWNLRLLCRPSYPQKAGQMNLRKSSNRILEILFQQSLSRKHLHQAELRGVSTKPILIVALSRDKGMQHTGKVLIQRGQDKP